MAVEILFEFKFDCHNCDDMLKKERGCIENGILPFYFDDGQIFRCPIKIVTPLSWEYIKAFNFYEKSILPNGKGWLEESNKYLQAMMILKNKFTEASDRKKR